MEFPIFPRFYHGFPIEIATADGDFERHGPGGAGCPVPRHASTVAADPAGVEAIVETWESWGFYGYKLWELLEISIFIAIYSYKLWFVIVAINGYRNVINYSLHSLQSWTNW